MIIKMDYVFEAAKKMTTKFLNVLKTIQKTLVKWPGASSYLRKYQIINVKRH
jgi:hypothetical protein